MRWRDAFCTLPKEKPALLCCLHTEADDSRNSTHPALCIPSANTLQQRCHTTSYHLDHDTVIAHFCHFVDSSLKTSLQFILEFKLRNPQKLPQDHIPRGTDKQTDFGIRNWSNKDQGLFEYRLAFFYAAMLPAMLSKSDLLYSPPGSLFCVVRSKRQSGQATSHGFHLSAMDSNNYDVLQSTKHSQHIITIKLIVRRFFNQAGRTLPRQPQLWKAWQARDSA